jgi:hypothetical protein
MTALIVHSQGVPAALMHGKAIFLVGPRGSKGGFGMEQNPHSWAAVEHRGIVDVSLKKEVLLEGTQIKFPFFAVAASETVPGGKGKVLLVRDESKYQQLIAEGSKRKGASMLIYFTIRGEELDRGHIIYSDRWINSTLTDDLRRRYGRANEAYAALLVHLIELFQGEVRSIADSERWAAWDTLMSRQNEALPKAVSLVQKRLPLPEAVAQPAASGDGPRAACSVRP